MSHTFIDKTGLELKPGDFIIYAHALGRCASLQYGVVLEIVPPKEDSWNPDGPYPRLRVQGVEGKDNYLGRPRYVDNEYSNGKHPELLKKGLLYFPSRVLKVSDDQIPPHVLALLQQVPIPPPK